MGRRRRRLLTMMTSMTMHTFELQRKNEKKMNDKMMAVMSKTLFLDYDDGMKKMSLLRMQRMQEGVMTTKLMTMKPTMTL